MQGVVLLLADPLVQKEQLDGVDPTALLNPYPAL